MLELTEVASPALTLFEKIFNPLKQYADYQLDRVNFNTLSNQAHEKLVGLAQVRTINEFDRSVSLYDFYVPPQVTGIELKNTFVVKTLDDFTKQKKILISGIVGQGKSILMKNLVIQESYKSEKFPIFIELRYLNENENLEKFVGRSICDLLGLESNKLHSYLLKEAKVILFFDGFDEIKTNEMGRVVKEFERLEKKFPKLKFIVSSRPEETIEKSTIFSKYIINKLDLNGQINIIEKLTDQFFLKKNLIENLKKTNQDIQGVLVTPLMVNFYYYLFKTEQIKGTDITLFYDQLFDLTLRKHDGTKLVYERSYVTGLDAKKLQSVFECLCFLTCKEKIFFLSEYKFLDLVSKAINFEKLDCNVNELVRDLTTGICFIYREGQTFAFLHTSIPEFFAAKFILRQISLDGFMGKIIDNYQDYINVLNYMKVIDEKSFMLSFLKPILDSNIEYFKTKKILNNIYISSKYYDKNKGAGNLIKVITLFDPIVHAYIAFNFRDFIKPYIREEINNKFKRSKKTNYRFCWTPKKSSVFNNDEVEQSENYFLHERLDNLPAVTVSNKRKQILSDLKEDEFKAIAESFSQRSEIIEKALILYILRLEKWMEKIKKYESSSIDELF